MINVLRKLIFGFKITSKMILTEIMILIIIYIKNVLLFYYNVTVTHIIVLTPARLYFMLFCNLLFTKPCTRKIDAF